MTIILASASPRRQELLARLGLPFTVQVPDLDEDRFTGLPPRELVETLSREKALQVARQQQDDQALIIAADTVVTLESRILGKPRDRAEAAHMLSALSGRSHNVFTGLTLMQGGLRETVHEVSTVHFRPLTHQEIDWYVATGEPMDKAGAYGIQGLGALFVAGLEGDYFNVMGLPVCRLGQLLSARFGLEVLQLAAQ